MLVTLNALIQLLNVNVFLQTSVAWYVLFFFFVTIVKLLNVVLIFYIPIMFSSGSEHGMGQFVVIAFAKTPYDISLDDGTQNLNDQVIICVNI